MTGEGFRHADGLCYKAHQARYGSSLSMAQYQAIMAAAEAAEDAGDGGADEPQAGG
jgi:hypothetical protein